MKEEGVGGEDKVGRKAERERGRKKTDSETADSETE